MIYHVTLRMSLSWKFNIERLFDCPICVMLENITRVRDVENGGTPKIVGPVVCFPIRSPPLKDGIGGGG